VVFVCRFAVSIRLELVSHVSLTGSKAEASVIGCAVSVLLVHSKTQSVNSSRGCAYGPSFQGRRGN
jgi:hypothetical protein